MGCVSSLPPQTNNDGVPISSGNDVDSIYKPTNERVRQLEYPRTCNEMINNPYSINDWIEVREHVSNQWVVATVIDKQHNWIKVLSQNINMQFTAKLHLSGDFDRIRPLGSCPTNSKPEIDKNNLLNVLQENGLEIINEIKYDERDGCKDTIYKAFEYQIYHSLDNNFKKNIFLHINNETNNEYFEQNISNWSQCKKNNDLLTDNDILLILSHYCKLHVISYQFDENSNDLQIIFDRKYDGNDNENIIALLYIAEKKQYKLMSMAMHKIIKLIDDNNDIDVRTWNVEQIIKWLNMIEFGLFNDKKYENLKLNIEKLEINGSNIMKMNDLFLKSIGIKEEFVQKLIVNNIEKLLSEKQKTETFAGINTHIIEEEEAGDIGDIRHIEIPESFLDPIHYLIMRDPVISIVSGHSFERQSITEWINAKHTDPINQKELHLHQLVPNRTLREAIERFLKIYGSQFTETKR